MFHTYLALTIQIPENWMHETTLSWHSNVIFDRESELPNLLECSIHKTFPQFPFFFCQQGPTHSLPVVAFDKNNPFPIVRIHHGHVAVHCRSNIIMLALTKKIVKEADLLSSRSLSMSRQNHKELGVPSLPTGLHPTFTCVRARGHRV